MHRTRKSGILLHPTSLPGPGGIGSLGEEARRFADFLHAAGQTLWQVLPLGPTAYGNSPYSAFSAFAGNPLLIDLHALAAEGDLDPSCLADDLPLEWVDYPAVEQHKPGLLRRAATAFFAGASRERKEEFWHFCDTTCWLHDFALFMALKCHFRGLDWSRWPADIARREPAAMAEYSDRLGDAIGEQKYVQWQFFRQWHRLREYANGRGVAIIGDMPIFVAHDSVDVWANRQLFHLDDQGKPTVVAGVPPDYFSKTGQLWGNPLYDWERMAADGHAWWVARLKNDLDLYDMVRIDHFRGFEACWEVKAGAKTAVNGRWVKGPGEAIFHAMRAAIGRLPLIAEDLGVITPEVEGLRDRFGLPGMKILQFAFDSGPDNPYLPHNFTPGCVVYTGTHDNDTTAGWVAALSPKEKKRIHVYLGSDGSDPVWELIRCAIASVAEFALIPMQDLLELPGEARMNLPGSPHGNWEWRCPANALDGRLAERLRTLTEMFGRLPQG
jgi:4-alpha-glucanotransferase